MVEDIRDALLGFQVGNKKPKASGYATKIRSILQTIQQQSIYDQNCRLIVSYQIYISRMYLILVVDSRMLV